MTDACWKCREHAQALQSARTSPAPAAIGAILQENATAHYATHHDGECELCAVFLRDLGTATDQTERRGIEQALVRHQEAPHRVWVATR